MTTREQQKAAVDKVTSLFQTAKATTISSQQAATSKDRGVKGSAWCSKVELLPPKDTDVRAQFLEAIAGLSHGDEAFTLPSFGPIGGEWVGRRSSGGAKSSAEPALSEQQKFQGLVQDCTSSITIFYVHGGAYAFGSPVTARAATISLSTMT